MSECSYFNYFNNCAIETPPSTPSWPPAPSSQPGKQNLFSLLLYWIQIIGFSPSLPRPSLTTIVLASAAMLYILLHPGLALYGNRWAGVLQTRTLHRQQDFYAGMSQEDIYNACKYRQPLITFPMHTSTEFRCWASSNGIIRPYHCGPIQQVAAFSRFLVCRNRG